MDLTLQNRLNEAIAKAIRERWTYSKLRAQLNAILNLYYTKSAIKNKILRDLIKQTDYQWLVKRNLDSEQKAKLNDIFINQKYGVIDNYAKQKQGINKDIKKVFELALERDTTIDGIKDELNSLNMKYKHWSETITRTAISAVSSLQFQIKSEDAGITKFIYTGPAPERDLCKSLYGNTYTVEQINRLSSQLGYDVMIYRGLWNCKHRWEAVLDENAKPINNTNTNQIQEQEQTKTIQQKQTNNANVARTPQEAKTLQANWIKSLGADDAMEIFDYTGADAAEINETLRGDLSKISPYQHEAINKKIDKLNGILKSAPNYEGEVYRGVSFSFKAQYDKFTNEMQVGKIFTESGFLSTSMSETVANKFSQEEYPVRLTIKSKTGTLIDALSQYPEEKEVLFNSNSKFLVIDKKINSKTNVTSYLLEEL